jgi:hypothetical protein
MQTGPVINHIHVRAILALDLGQPPLDHLGALDHDANPTPRGIVEFLIDPHLPDRPGDDCSLVPVQLNMFEEICGI